jgi:hypothetical protein
MSKSVFLLVTSAFMVDGQIAKAGEVVEVSNTEAKDLLNRGKAKLATIDAAQLEDAVEVEPKEDAPAGAEAPQEAPAGEQPAEDAAAGAEAPQEAAGEVAQGDDQETKEKPAKSSKKGK